MLKINSVLDERYRIEKELGRGGSAVVYLAEDLRLGRKIAVKELGSDVFYRHPSNEAEILKRLDHPAFPAVFDVLEADGKVMILMEYVAGQTLDQILQEFGVQPEEQARSWFIQLAEALQYLHAKHIVYLDMKPGNIIVQEDGRLKLLDFGIARVLEQTVMKQENFQGTMPYMAPETMQRRFFDQRSDIYSLGMTMLRVLVPDDGSVNLAENPQVSDALALIIRTCIRENPEERYQTAAELLEKLQTVEMRAKRRRVRKEQEEPDRRFGYEMQQRMGAIDQREDGRAVSERLLSLGEYQYILKYGSGTKALKPITSVQLMLTNLKGLRYLHIVGYGNLDTEDSPAYPSAIRISQDGRCLLLIQCKKELCERMLSRYAGQLETLQIYDLGLPILDLNNFTRLSKLSLRTYFQCIKEIPRHMLPGLEELRLRGIACPHGLVLDEAQKLRILSLEDCNIPFLDVTGPHPNLMNLLIDNVQTELPELRYLPGLKCLFYRNIKLELTDLQDLPKKLWILDLSGTNLREIPEWIRDATSLERLVLREMHLTDLPDWLPERAYYFDVGQHATIMAEETGFVVDLNGTVVDAVKTEILSRPRNMIREWFQARNSKDGDEQIPLNEIKVVFLGNGSAGKTYTISRLMNNCGGPVNYTDQATPGIRIENLTCDIDGSPVRIHFWDFGGQEIMHAMHRMFLTERTIYVILVDARSNQQQDEQARYWLSSIRSFARKAPVILALNRMDENPNASLDAYNLRKKYPELSRILKMSAKEATPTELREGILQAILDEIRKEGTFAAKWNKSWIGVKRNLQDMTDPYIFGTGYDEICEKQGVAAENRKDLLNWFNDLGISVCYHRDAALSHYVILRPDWITNALYTITFNRPRKLKNGVLTHEEIFSLLQSADYRVKKDEQYNYSDLDYVLRVARKFHLSYPVSQNREFFPSLCDHNTLAVVEEYADDPGILEFHMVYEHLPINVLHRLMVDLNRDLDMEQIWFTGARFRKQTTGLSAVVQKDGERLKLYVRSENSRFPPDLYLTVLRSAVAEINRELNLNLICEEIGYKSCTIENQVSTEFFDYEIIVNSIEVGFVFSKKLRRLVRVEDILHRTNYALDEEQAKLLRDLQTCCLQMQDNTFLSNMENARNTELRISLTNLGHDVRDQSLGGYSASGLQPGERDLVFFRKNNCLVIWTMLEALKIKGTSRQDLDNWNEHLFRLMRRYDQMGLPFQILVSYVDCPQDKFLDLCNCYFVHIKHHSPQGCYVQSMLPVKVGEYDMDQTGGFQMRKCVYDCGGFQKIIYHVFVRFEPRK